MTVAGTEKTRIGLCTTNAAAAVENQRETRIRELEKSEAMNKKKKGIERNGYECRCKAKVFRRATSIVKLCALPECDTARIYIHRLPFGKCM